MAEKGILFISNGYGEDTISSRIIQSLREKSTVPIFALPLVGQGHAYSACGIETVGPGRLMPSGGMIPGSVKNLITDFSSGLARLTLEQICAIKAMKKEVQMTVAVGDIYPVILSMLFSVKPVIMVGTAKSDYFYHYNWSERMVMRISCARVFTRDELTAASLRKYSIDAEWVGNAMMDSLTVTGIDFGLVSGYPVVALLPGSRKEAYNDIAVILESVQKLSKRMEGKVSFVMAVADSIPVPSLFKDAEQDGWTLKEGNKAQGALYVLSRDSLSIAVSQGVFGDVLVRAAIVVGQAGTGNEQAVGMGKPVVTFESSGKKSLGWYRMRQKGLLGDSISVVDKDDERIAMEAFSILSDEDRYRQMERIGHERMGPPGAADRMASCILERLEA